MQRALELAQLGLGKVSPNPLVGCVIVHENQIAGEGWHQQYGGPHAEVNAIEAVRDKTLLKESDVYVTLEPCAHYGKTPPCANLLAEHKVKRVIICNADTNPLVAGKGVKILTGAGIEVVENVLAAKGKLINKRFFTYFNKKRPYIILKWAETGDGFIHDIDVELSLIGELSPEQRERLREISDRCPVHRTLTSEIKIRSRLSDD